MTEALDDAALDGLMDGASQAVGLAIPPEYRDGVRANLRALLEVGRSLVEVEKPARPIVEVAPVYQP